MFRDPTAESENPARERHTRVVAPCTARSLTLANKAKNLQRVVPHRAESCPDCQGHEPRHTGAESVRLGKAAFVAKLWH